MSKKYIYTVLLLVALLALFAVALTVAVGKSGTPVEAPDESAIKLADDPKTAMEIMLKIDEIEEQLPGIDCASCGSPSCACFAQDVVMGNSELHDCVFIMKKELLGDK